MPDPQAWLYRSLSVTDDGLVLRCRQANPNPDAVDGYDVVPVGEPERIPQRFDLPALWYSVDGTAFGEGDLPHLGLAHLYLNHYRCRRDYDDLLSRTACQVTSKTGPEATQKLGHPRAGSAPPTEQLTASSGKGLAGLPGAHTAGLMAGLEGVMQTPEEVAVMRQLLERG